MSKPLAASTSVFRDIINGGFVYIDKTHHIYNLAHKAKGAFFLSRPRRFGKSLLVSTLEELFLGNRELFNGLWIDSSDYEVEVLTNDGRIDAVAEVPDRIFLFEFKLDQNATKALDQIKKHKYYQKYKLRGKPITCVGANFSTESRTVDDWDILEA